MFLRRGDNARAPRLQPDIRPLLSRHLCMRGCVSAHMPAPCQDHVKIHNRI